MKYAKTNIIDYIKLCPDPRKSRGSQYKFVDLVLMMIYAVLCNCSTAVKISEFVEVNFEFFKNNIGLKKVPSHDTFSRLLRMINFTYLSEVLNQWLMDNFPEMHKKYGDLEVLHIDGKCVKAASEKSKGEKPRYALNAMYEGGTISLKTYPVGDKENETGNIVNQLKMFTLANLLVTADAASMTSNVINYIVKENGYFLFPVKENQKNLYKCIESMVESYENSLKIDGKTKFSDLKSFSVTSEDHGRIDTYKMTVIVDTEPIFKRFGTESYHEHIARVLVLDKWSETVKEGKPCKTHSRSYLVTNATTLSAEELLQIKRSHWNIEMEHYKLDVIFGEDRMTARRDNAMINNTILKRFVMNIKNGIDEYKDRSLSFFMMANTVNLEKLSKYLFGGQK